MTDSVFMMKVITAVPQVCSAESVPSPKIADLAVELTLCANVGDFSRSCNVG